MINNYIFDFGNVLAGYDPEKLVACCVEDKERIKLLSEVVFDRLYWDRLDDGSYMEEDLKVLLKDRLEDDLYDDACRIIDSWIENLEKIYNMCNLTKDIKDSGKKLYLLSNISRGFSANYTKTPWINELLSRFDGLVFSGDIGIVKPNREIFEYILKKYGLKAEECVFIDDSEKNIAGCEAVGIKGYLFDGNADRLRRQLGY